MTITTPPPVLTLHELADTLSHLTTTEATPVTPDELDQLITSVTHHHQQSGGPLRTALSHLLTHTDNPDRFTEAITMFSLAVDLHAPPPPGQLTLF